MELTHKDKEFVMLDAEMNTLEELKSKLISASVLRLSNAKLPYIVMTDASDYAIGSVLEQKEDNVMRPVAYCSRTLTKSQRNWPTYDKELYAIMQATKQWRTYLAGRKFTIYTDHVPLRYLRNKEHLPHRHADYLDWLSMFDFEVHCKPRKLNSVADALLRREDLKELNAILALEADETRIVQIVQGYDDDPCSAGVKSLLSGKGEKDILFKTPIYGTTFHSLNILDWCGGPWHPRQMSPLDPPHISITTISHND
jgi:hypothetical protein